MVLEKMWAKVHGNYAIMEGGDPALCCRDLTGAPSYTIKSGDYNENDLWN